MSESGNPSWEPFVSGQVDSLYLPTMRCTLRRFKSLTYDQFKGMTSEMESRGKHLCNNKFNDSNFEKDFLFLNLNDNSRAVVAFNSDNKVEGFCLFTVGVNIRVGPPGYIAVLCAAGNRSIGRGLGALLLYAAVQIIQREAPPRKHIAALTPIPGCEWHGLTSRESA